jgi:hypothetical protein
MDLKLKDKVAIITGASRGIGAITAQPLLSITFTAKPEPKRCLVKSKMVVAGVWLFRRMSGTGRRWTQWWILLLKNLEK